MDVEYSNGTTDTIRLLGVDTPEVYRSVSPDEFDVPDTDDGRTWLSDWGDNASAFASGELEGKQVRITVDETADRRGSYGRLLVYVYDDGELFNRQLLSGGYARVYPSTFTKRDSFERVESDARTNGSGVWGYSGTDEETTADGPLAVATIHADAAGTETENLDDEYVTFENTDAATLEMGGWTVCDAADHCYTVPADFSLGAGESVTLYTGSGTDSADALYWGSESPIWNNGGDTITVREADGTVVLQREYD